MSDLNPGTWVDPEVIESQPWKSQNGIIKLVEFPQRNAKMSRRAFHLYWTRHHSPHVMNLTSFAQFIRKYVTSLTIDAPSLAVPANYALIDRYEGASELWLDSLEELEKWFGQPVYEQLIAHDETRFLAQDGGEMIFAKEEPIYTADPDLSETGKVRAFIVLAKPAFSAYDQFHNDISQLARSITEVDVLKTALLKLSVSHRICDPLPEGIPFADIDAVIEMTFDDSDTMQAVFSAKEFVQLLDDMKASCDKDQQVRVQITQSLVIHDEYSFQPSTTQPLAI